MHHMYVYIEGKSQIDNAISFSEYARTSSVIDIEMLLGWVCQMAMEIFWQTIFIVLAIIAES